MSVPIALSGIACRRLVTPDHILDHVFLEFDGPRFGIAGDFNSSWLAPDAFNARQDGWIVIPGFVDVHLHGAMSHDYLDHTQESMAAISAWSAEGGTTSTVATLTIPNADHDLTEYSKFVDQVQAAHPLVLDEQAKTGRLQDDPAVSGLPGSRLIGIHLEGPFLNPERRGAFDPATHLRIPDTQFIAKVLDLSAELLVKITMAPELPHGMEVIDQLLSDPRTPIEIAPGHTIADYAFAARLFENPRIRTITHMFNAMSSIHHRSPNLVTAALLDDRVSVEVIPDGLHVAPPLLKLLHRVKGPKRFIAITDATAVAGMPEGVPVPSFGRSIVIRNGVPRLPDGTFAGSALSMAEAFHNLVHKADVPLQHAVEMCTKTPARSLHMERVIGDVQPGYRADLAVIEEATGKVVATIRDGRLIYQNPDITIN
jgi:N-acetylglucosamine-6-phosphate deacetylase